MFCNTTLDGDVVWSKTSLLGGECCESRKLAFFFCLPGTQRDNSCYFIRQVPGKVDSLDEWVSILAVKRINTGALGETSRDAIPRG